MENRRYAGFVVLLLIGIHLTGAENGTSVAPVDTECKSPGDFTKSWTEYVKEGDNITMIVCDDDDICKFKRGDDKYCFRYKDNTNKKCSTAGYNKDEKVKGEIVEGKYCKITIPEMSEALKGEWTLDFGEQEETFNLKLEEDFSNITIILAADKVLEDLPVNVTCKVSGGVPKVKASDITFMLMDSNNTIVDGSEDRFSKSSIGKTDTGDDVQVTKSFKIKRDDHGLWPCCKVEQKDSEGNVLHPGRKMTEESLDVKFGPKKVSEPKYSENNTVTITIESNPIWTTWNLTATDVCHGDNLNCTDSFLNSTKYEKEKEDHILVDLKKVKDSSFKYELTIKALKIEHMANTTVAINIANQIGEPLKIEAFPLVTKGSSDTTTQKPGDNSSDSSANPSDSTQVPEEQGTERGLSGGAVAAIVIFVILGIGAGVYFYRKRMGSGSERMPLSGTSMSSLGSR